MTETIKVGNLVPDFSLPSQLGKNISPQDYRGKKALVIYFYPKDETPGCTKQACSFRDHYEDFQNEGVEILGISSDSVSSHQNFASHHKLPFPILADVEGGVRKLFGVPKTMGLLPGRVTYVVDKNGVVRHIFSSQLNVTKHIQEALKAIKIQKT
ncbi:MAG: peroxiredoxin [Deltaproteobacteria bacterium RIFCSPLOWO2_12_FULL_40_28]|nr:MAG: peroxiredoxin [Deltaproteobacteria bacterium RIFCSPHIGHO2_02_FULL_40_28]OGQ19401.1 MAG: peroxiredoxin [Deltaproteobacteria bacterium RIFCSPHIGHO2_12_FULL_40_32]OGQ39845.1 MAG: peroxiredoxin [Deltaproteobacteria bacterium RIFCSPLOWO2_02_FULL_40_36]OGQ53839.1 MAG: peroxiredoxin [Deltaproteobacteria bacterium RIFCSPLOWO2_12_FULL_40_28]